MGMLKMMTEAREMINYPRTSFRRVPAYLVAKKGHMIVLWVLLLSVGDALLWINWCIGGGKECRWGEF